MFRTRRLGACAVTILIGCGALWSCDRFLDNMAFPSWVDAKAVSPDGRTAAYVVCFDACDVPEMRRVAILPADYAQEVIDRSSRNPMRTVDIPYRYAGPGIVAAPDMDFDLRWTGNLSLLVTVSCLTGALPAPTRFRDVEISFAGGPAGVACQEQIT